MIVAAVLVVLGSIGAFFLYHYLKKEYTAKMEALVEAKLKVGLASVKMLDFPLVICFAASITRFSWEQLKSLHEGCRNSGHLIFLDTIEMIREFKRKGKVVIFWSYQWLSWDSPGPLQIQWECMKQSLDSFCEIKGVQWEDIYVWLDIISIPQFNSATKGLAVNGTRSRAKQTH